VKILTNCSLPFSLAHGGQAIQIERTMSALNEIGVETEPLRWWDERQTGDVILYFGRMPVDHIRFAQRKNIRTVMAELLTAQGSRSASQLRRQKMISRLIARLVPRSFISAFNWDSYRMANAFVALTSWEKQLMEYLFNATPEKVFVVPNGVEEIFFQAPKCERGPWLVCTATITERKRILELAEAAVAAQTPLWILGRAYADDDPYAQRFFRLAKRHPKLIRFEGAISDRARLAEIYREAHGFVLLSTMESLSLSALEAAAGECPLLLSDLPWARSTFAHSASYCPVARTSTTATVLRQFYDAAPTLPRPPRPATWKEVAEQFKSVFEKVLNQKSTD
jgi:glycosyltransferase involved in cell wall biosynthesis